MLPLELEVLPLEQESPVSELARPRRGHRARIQRAGWEELRALCSTALELFPATATARILDFFGSQDTGVWGRDLGLSQPRDAPALPWDEQPRSCWSPAHLPSHLSTQTAQTPQIPTPTFPHLVWKAQEF